MIDTEQTLRHYFGDKVDTLPGRALVGLLRRLLHEDDINRFIQTHGHLHGFAFLERILEEFDFHFSAQPDPRHVIPAEGRLIIVANHPIGSLDGLTLLKLVHTVRPDVRIVANELLNRITPLRSLFIAVDNMRESHASHRQAYRTML